MDCKKKKKLLMVFNEDNSKSSIKKDNIPLCIEQIIRTAESNVLTDDKMSKQLKNIALSKKKTILKLLKMTKTGIFFMSL